MTDQQIQCFLAVVRTGSISGGAQALYVTQPAASRCVRTLEEELGYVGEIREVNAGILRNAAKDGYIPIVSTVAAGYHGEVYNINADVAAARIAAELGAMKLILMTDVRGLLRNREDESTIIPVVNVSDVRRLKKEGVISGGMIPKIDCCVDAVRRGVGRAHIIDGRIAHSILVELFTDEGIGTMFY